MQEEKFNYLTKLAASPTFAKDASEAIVKLSKGDFKVDEANDYSAIYAQETPENQAKIRSYVRQQFIDINTTNNEIEKEKVDKLKAQANEIELEYYRTKNPKLLKDLVQISKDSEGKAISANTIESIKKSGAEKEGDVQYTDNVIKLKDEIKKGRFDSIDALYARGANLGVSRRTINQYVAPSYLSKSDALLDEVISNGASMLTPSGSTASKVRKQQELHQETDRLYDLQDTTKPIKSKAEISAELIDKKIKGNSAKSSQVTELNNMASAYGLQFTSVSKLDDNSIADIDRKVKDKAIRQSIKDKLKALGN